MESALSAVFGPGAADGPYRSMLPPDILLQNAGFLIEKTTDTLKALNAIENEFMRAEHISSVQNAKVKRKREEPGQLQEQLVDTYPTDAEMTRMRDDNDRLSELTKELKTILRRQIALRSQLIERARMRKNRKARLGIFRRHCDHCKGRKSRCGCHLGCAMIVDGINRGRCFSHCEHCRGEGTCTCPDGCAKIQPSKARCTNTAPAV